MKMQHVTILTKYFDEEIRFYEDYAGLKIVRDMRPHMDLVFLADGPEETKVEIIRNPEICVVFICILLVTDKSTRQKPGKSNASLSSFLGDKAVCFLAFEEGDKGSYFCPRGALLSLWKK